MFPMNLFHHNPTALDARVKALPRAEPTPKQSFRARYIIPLAIIVALAGAATPVYGKALYRYVSNYFSGNNVTVPIVSPTPEPTYRLTPTPENTPTLENRVTPTPEPTPTITPTTTLEAKLFEFVCHGCTDDEQYKKFAGIAKSDYEHVAKVYGINPKESVFKAILIADTGEYGFELKYKGLYGSQAWVGKHAWTEDPNDPGLKGEIAHAFNRTFFRAKDDREPWYNTFDEGSTLYASGRVEAGKTGGSDFKKDDGSLTTIVGNQAILDYLIANPNQFWERIDFQVSPFNSPGHLTGLYLFWLLEHEGLTPEKHTVALQKLAEYYKEPDTKTNQEMIQLAYEFALGKNLNYLFNDWLQPGINRFYATATPTPR